MKVIEFLASQLDRELKEKETLGNPELMFENLDYWYLCMEAFKILEERKNDKDNPR